MFVVLRDFDSRFRVRQNRESAAAVCRTIPDGTTGRIAPMKGIRIRHLTADFLEQKADVHARTWRETYSGMLPQELVDAITPAFALKVTRLRILRAYGLSSDRADSGCGRRCGSGGRVGEF